MSIYLILSTFPWVFSLLVMVDKLEVWFCDKSKNVFAMYISENNWNANKLCVTKIYNSFYFIMLFIINFDPDYFWRHEVNHKMQLNCIFIWINEYELGIFALYTTTTPASGHNDQAIYRNYMRIALLAATTNWLQLGHEWSLGPNSSSSF